MNHIGPVTMIDKTDAYVLWVYRDKIWWLVDWKEDRAELLKVAATDKQNRYAITRGVSAPVVSRVAV